MSDKKETIFIEGARFFKPRENAPSWIKGNMVINLSELREFIKKNNVTETLRMDLCKSEKKGTYYFTLNTWNPTKKEVGDDDIIDPENIPF